MSELQTTEKESASDSASASGGYGYGLIEDLQSQIDELEDKVKNQSSTINILEAKLDARYEEIFKYRMEAQKARQDNEVLQDELRLFLSKQDK